LHGVYQTNMGFVVNSDRPLMFRIAFYCTGHGLGHATRVIEVCRELLNIQKTDRSDNRRPESNVSMEVFIVSSLPKHVFLSAFKDHPRKAFFTYRQLREPLDCGGIQADAFAVEPVETLETYMRIAGASEKREKIIREEVNWLLSMNISFVCSDTVPLACRCAKLASIPSAVISNLSWDFIYQQFTMFSKQPERSAYEDMVAMITKDYECASLLLRLPGAHPMPAFDHIQPSSMAKVGRKAINDKSETILVNMPFVVRPARKSKEQIKRDLGIEGNDAKLVLLMFGGLSGNVSFSPDLEALPDGWICLVCHAIWPQNLDNLQLTKKLQRFLAFG